MLSGRKKIARYAHFSGMIIMPRRSDPNGHSGRRPQKSKRKEHKQKSWLEVLFNG
jgi:hypothetical protein